MGTRTVVRSKINVESANEREHMGIENVDTLVAEADPAMPEAPAEPAEPVASPEEEEAGTPEPEPETGDEGGSQEEE